MTIEKGQHHERNRFSWLHSSSTAPFHTRLRTGPAAGDYTKLATPGDYVVRDFKFPTGETLGEVREHYASSGEPRRNTAGQITNAVLLLHGTMGSGVNWGAASAASPNVHPLLGPGGALDVSEYYVIAPDTIGAGKSSKPSDVLRMKFPHYNRRHRDNGARTSGVSGS
jgi:homoserine O-acetyltransferase/O-succinyltransferase